MAMDEELVSPVLAEVSTQLSQAIVDRAVWRTRALRAEAQVAELQEALAQQEAEAEQPVE